MPCKIGFDVCRQRHELRPSAWWLDRNGSTAWCEVDSGGQERSDNEWGLNNPLITYATTTASSNRSPKNLRLTAICRATRAEMDPMQKTHSPPILGNPQKSVTTVSRNSLCQNHSTSAYPTSGAYQRKVRNTHSLPQAPISRYTRANFRPMLHVGNRTSYGPAKYLCPIRCTYRGGIRPFIEDVDDRLPDLNPACGSCQTNPISKGTFF
jgi:hypothetical protein